MCVNIWKRAWTSSLLSSSLPLLFRTIKIFSSLPLKSFLITGVFGYIFTALLARRLAKTEHGCVWVRGTGRGWAAGMEWNGREDHYLPESPFVGRFARGYPLFFNHPLLSSSFYFFIGAKYSRRWLTRYPTLYYQTPSSLLRHLF